MELAVESLETPALTKAQLAELLFDQIGLNKRESKDMIDAFFDLVTDSLVDGSDVKISGFGNFQIRTKAPRPGRNPRTGEPVAIQARRVVTFHASPKLKAPNGGDFPGAVLQFDWISVGVTDASAPACNVVCNI
jgi:integration host factor subunit alpha